MSINLDKLYESACENLKAVCRLYYADSDDAEKMYATLTKDAESFLRGNVLPQILPALEIWNAAHEELCKSSGGTSYTAMKRIIKGVVGRPNLEGAWLDSYGHQCVCDGYRAVRLLNPVDGLKEASGSMDLSAVFPASLWNWEMMALPSPGELRACIAEQKGRRGKFYDFGEGMPMVNAQYLKDIMDILPDAVAYRDPESPNRPIVFVSDAGDALLLPVRKNV